MLQWGTKLIRQDGRNDPHQVVQGWGAVASREAALRITYTADPRLVQLQVPKTVSLAGAVI